MKLWARATTSRITLNSRISPTFALEIFIHMQNSKKKIMGWAWRSGRGVAGTSRAWIREDSETQIEGLYGRNYGERKDRGLHQRLKDWGRKALFFWRVRLEEELKAWNQRFCLLTRMRGRKILWYSFQNLECMLRIPWNRSKPLRTWIRTLIMLDVSCSVLEQYKWTSAFQFIVC